MSTERKLSYLIGLLLGAIMLALLLMSVGCSHTTYNPTTKEIVVDRFLNENELNGLEIVFPDGSYVLIDQASSKVNQEGLALLQLLIRAGMLKAPTPGIVP